MRKFFYGMATWQKGNVINNHFSHGMAENKLEFINRLKAIAKEEGYDSEPTSTVAYEIYPQTIIFAADEMKRGMQQ